MGFCAQYPLTSCENELPTVGERTTREDDGLPRRSARVRNNNHGHAEHTADGVVFGAMAGYNYQLTQNVELGVEADIGYFAAKNTTEVLIRPYAAAIWRDRFRAWPCRLYVQSPDVLWDRRIGRTKLLYRYSTRPTIRLVNAASHLSSRTGPGGGGNIATEAVVRASPDGYTLLQVATTHAINGTLFDKLNFDFARDIVRSPASAGSQCPGGKSIVPANTVPEFIAYAKANPGRVNFASGGNGGNLHLAANCSR